jgi:hypothetical protein
MTPYRRARAAGVGNKLCFDRRVPDTRVGRWQCSRHGGRTCEPPATNGWQRWPAAATRRRSRRYSSATTAGCCHCAATCWARSRRRRTRFSTPSRRPTGSCRRATHHSTCARGCTRPPVTAAPTSCVRGERSRPLLPRSRRRGCPRRSNAEAICASWSPTSATYPTTSGPPSSCPRSRTSHTPRWRTCWAAGGTRSARSCTRPGRRWPAGARRVSCRAERCARRSRSRAEAGFAAAT